MYFIFITGATLVNPIVSDISCINSFPINKKILENNLKSKCVFEAYKVLLTLFKAITYCFYLFNTFLIVATSFL